MTVSTPRGWAGLLVSGGLVWAGLGVPGCDGGSDGTADDGVTGSCFADDFSDNCYCSASATPNVGYHPASGCFAAPDRACCGAPFEGASEPYEQCSCYVGNTTCADNLVQVNDCGSALYHAPSGGSGSCDQCQYDSECDYGCSVGETGYCDKSSGCGSCYCQ